MGDVGIKYRVMPESLEIDLAKLKVAIGDILPKEASIKGIEEKPVAFGLKSLEMMIVINDRDGGPDKVEEAIAGVEGVMSCDVLEMGLL